MNAKIVLDVSSIVWDEQNFITQPSLYYQLAGEVVMFIQAFESAKKLKFVSRLEMMQNVTASFPYKPTNNPKLFDFKKRSQQFLSNRYKDFVTFKTNNSTVESIPDICHEYFSDIIKIEIKYLISEMHYNENYIFCTFRSRWKTNSDLQTKNRHSKTHTTVIHEATKPTILDYYNKNIRNVFEHNTKHDSNKGVYFVKSEKVNPLSCYDERLADTTIPQQYLDNAIQYKNDFYYYDDKNKTFIRFKMHSKNKYHGFDEEKENVPQQIREKFHK